MPECSVTVPAEAHRLPELNALLESFWRQTGLPDDLRFAFELSLEEVFMNVAMHGAAPGAATPVVFVHVSSDDRRVTLIVEDDATAFDPLRQLPPDTSAPLEERSVGGLGIFLVREMMDSVDYERAGQRNRLVMSKAID